MTADRIPDRAERERALNPERSFLVRAPAGSGKTGLLIQRYLLLLARVESPEEIVAITFTKKAAGEMRQRVLNALAAARTGATPESAHEMRTIELARAAVAQDERRDWRIAHNPARLRIQTIDAFCAGLVCQMPMLSRLGAQRELIEDAQALYLEAARATVAMVGSDTPVADHIACLLDHLDNDVERAAALIADMLARRDQWMRHLGGLDRAALESALAGVRAAALARVRSVAPDVKAIANYAFANLERPPFADDYESWAALADVLLTQKDDWRKVFDKRQGFPPGNGDTWKARAIASQTGEEFRAALAEMRRLPPLRYSDAQWRVLAALGPMLKVALAQLDLVFRARGQIDFVKVARAALDALGEDGAPTELALALDYRIQHLLLDEFQDTSITQYELIAQLTEGWEPGDGRTVFAVGDPMQSIYRFREAEVGEFLRTWKFARLGGVAVEPVRLTANFRSQACIVEWVNAAFAQMMPAQENATVGAVPHTLSAWVKPALPGEAVEVHPFFNGDVAGEARRVIDLIARIRATAPEATIAVLVRNRGSLREIVPLLRDAKLRYRAIEIESLGSRPVVQDLLALTRALSYSADRLAWLAILRAPWCGLTLADLVALAEGDGVRTIWELMNDDERVARLSDDGRARLMRVRDLLAASLEKRLRSTLRDQVENVWLALGGPACVEDDTDIEDADIYLDALEEAEHAGALADPAGFERRLEKLWALPDVHASDKDVQIMTVHKAKGLEFDHVIVPGLGRTPQTDDKRLFLWTERAEEGAHGGASATQLLVGPIEEAGVEGDALYEWLKRLDAERTDHECARLLYVAATRARERLHLLATSPLDISAESIAPREPKKSALLAKLWPVVADKFDEAAAALPREALMKGSEAGTGERAPLNQDLVRLAAEWQCPAPPPAAEWQPPIDEARVHEEIEFSWAGETARHVGTVVHRWLQCIAADALAGWDDARIERSRNAVRNELSARGVRNADLDAATHRALSALAFAIRDERGRWLLGARKDAATEHRVTALLDGAIRRLVIDRMFVDESGKRWVVDYKTSLHEGADTEAFLDREQARYAAQLARYARALGDVDRLGLYFPLLAGWRES